jgi:hypothetical protein
MIAARNKAKPITDQAEGIAEIHHLLLVLAGPAPQHRDHGEADRSGDGGNQRRPHHEQKFRLQRRAMVKTRRNDTAVATDTPAASKAEPSFAAARRHLPP